MITITLLPKGERPIDIKISCCSHLKEADFGLWNIDTNEVVLSKTMYEEFSSLTKQSEKKSFFDKNLLKISQKTLNALTTY